MMPSNELAASVQPPNEVNNLEEGRRVEIIDDDNENQPVPFGDMVEADRRSEAEYLKARETIIMQLQLQLQLFLHRIDQTLI